MRTLRSFLFLLLLGACAAPAVAQEIIGIYDAKGQNPGGSGAYSAVVQIVPYGAAHAILWKLQDGSGNEGIALRQANVVGAAYRSSKIDFGLVVYRIAGGLLDGEWVTPGDQKAELGRETLEGPENLSGTYKITLGQNRDGTTNYTGEVIIKPEGDTYLLAWMVPELAYVGRGVRIGDVLVVAYGQGQDPSKLPGVVAYKIDDPNSMSGIWATAGSPKTGTETLTRRAAAQ
jgi:hypothetical protein